MYLQDPEDYGEVLGALREGGDAGPPAELRRRLAWKAFQHCATYDSTVAEWLWGQIGVPPHKGTYVASLKQPSVNFDGWQSHAHQAVSAWEEHDSAAEASQACKACFLLC